MIVYVCLLVCGSALSWRTGVEKEREGGEERERDREREKEREKEREREIKREKERESEKHADIWSKKLHVDCKYKKHTSMSVCPWNTLRRGVRIGRETRCQLVSRICRT